MGAPYREKRKASIYTLESHTNFLREVGVRVPLRVTTQLLGLDDKRMQVFHAMYNGETRDLLATTEVMLLHVDTGDGRGARLAIPARCRVAPRGRDGRAPSTAETRSGGPRHRPQAGGQPTLMKPTLTNKERPP